MFEFSESTLAFGQIALTFGCILLLLRKFPLWLAILAGCVVLAFLTGLPPVRLALIPARTAADPDFVILLLMILAFWCFPAFRELQARAGGWF